MLNFAVVGVGRMGSRHARNIASGRLFGVRLAAVCDIDDGALLKCKKYAPKARRYKDIDEMLSKERLDGVIIATPHYAHVDVAKKCISKCVNTLIEKPAAPTVEMIEDIENLANGSGVKVGVSYNQRSNRMYIKAKKLIESGKLGNIQRVDFIITNWYRSQAYYNQGGWRASYIGEGGGCLMNQCVHQLDILQWLVGVPNSVFASARTVDRKISVENDVTATFKFDGFDGTFAASTHELSGINRLEIACDKGRLVIGPLSMKVIRHKSQVEVNATTKRGYGFSPSFNYRVGYGFFRLLSDICFGQQLRSLRSFRNAINGKGEPLADISEGKNAMQIINGIYLSADSGQEIKLPIDNSSYAEYLERKKAEEKK